MITCQIVSPLRPLVCAALHSGLREGKVISDKVFSELSVTCRRHSTAKPTQTLLSFFRRVESCFTHGEQQRRLANTPCLLPSDRLFAERLFAELRPLQEGATS